MADAPTHGDQTAQDDAHLRSLGIKPELERSLGFLSNFAVAFSYISVSTGTYTLIGLGLAVGGPAFFWSWPIIIVGQLFVALNFAELSSHFPVAGSIYQWSKRLSNKTLGFFTGWIYFWAGVLTTTAVAITVPLVMSSIWGFALTDPSPIGIGNNLVFWAVVVLISTTIINSVGVKLLSMINNVGVAAEILGMLVFALILLIFFNHQPLSVLTTTAGLENQPGGSVPGMFLVAMFMSLFVVYGFDTAGTFGEETVGASRQAPRGVLTAVLLSGAIGTVFLLAIVLSIKDMPGEISAAQAFGLPIGDTINANMGDFGKVYLAIILAAVYVCTLAIQGATTRLMFSMGRDRRMPFGGTWGHVNRTFKTPLNAAVAVGVLSAIPFLVSDSPGVLAIGATGLIYTSYFLCNVGVLVARQRGWPHKGAWFSLGSWGTIINVLALVWGGAMIVNFAMWQTNIFGSLGSMSYTIPASGSTAASTVGLRDITNPLLNTLSFGGQVQTGLPGIPLFEFTLLTILVTGAIYYWATERRRLRAETTVADEATGEATIA
ncbi:MAG TPA: amino acid permease [Candidatus Limnocylindrales bacterium]